LSERPTTTLIKNRKEEFRAITMRKNPKLTLPTRGPVKVQPASADQQKTPGKYKLWENQKANPETRKEKGGKPKRHHEC